MVEANLGQRVSQPMWDAPQLGAKLNKSSAVPGMKYTWLSSLFNWKQAFLSLQQLSPQMPPLTALSPWTWTQRHRLLWQTNTVKALLPLDRSTSFFMSCSTHNRAECCVKDFKANKPASPPSFTGGGKDFKGGWEIKGDTFHQTMAWNLLRVCRCSEPAKAPWYAELESGGAGQIGERQGGSEMETETEEDIVKLNRCDVESHTSDKSNLAMPHLCKSHLIFPFPPIFNNRRKPVKYRWKEKPWSASLKTWQTNWSSVKELYRHTMVPSRKLRVVLKVQRRKQNI